jgi:hypothetical protein
MGAGASDEAEGSRRGREQGVGSEQRCRTGSRDAWQKEEERRKGKEGKEKRKGEKRKKREKENKKKERKERQRKGEKDFFKREKS